MSDSPFQELVRKLFETTKRVDAALAELKGKAADIEAKYEPRTEFNRWRNSQSGKLWKQQKYQAQNGRCVICGESIQLKGSHIDHKRPLSQYPHLALDTRNLRITCPECNTSKGNRCDEE
ncbi:HNH endonuclease [Lusitaniella coriacea LEGE 07157]|uniref:HNH endonuclease n=1 Tax=Lusitaniella coriacea LEGE 07157 TaxID=945747 RepID=A0A8J7IXC2_9CYAN|nr:HNH endonuclease [Lusitaniella coriacea]MBE9118633.1 HNH endonuclease [Lusitaniella coriacea LEGE 07157]